MQLEVQLEQMRQQHESQLKAQELAFQERLEKQKMEMDTAAKIMVARIQTNPGLDIPMLEAQQAVSDRIVQEMGADIKGAMAQIAATHADMTAKHADASAQHAETLGRIAQEMSKLAAPKRIVRGPDGRAAGVEIVQQQLPLPAAPMTRQ
jgi:hypothetical protein